MEQQQTSQQAPVEEAEEDSIEQIDAKDYPELYPELQSEEDAAVDTEWFVDPEFESQISETDFVPLWQRRAVGDHLQERSAMEDISKELMASGQITADVIKELLTESKMDNVTVLDLREKCDWTDYMIIAESAKGDRFLSSVAENLGGVVRKAIRSNPEKFPTQALPHIEGRDDDSGWLLIDLGRFIVHLFTPEIRQKYDLEGLWKAVPTDPSLPMPDQE
ncbi:uncharacterized protein BYT42DRAFT_639592 [Radiomyces spectabilis]|uniref:uncharacterized protein n=1 Tax=Radiomyces spectabilis TaxID=64574 RepID=UPI00221E960A|nr:uncharacterized protein BYT42DRAFT_639592 [Radiomyces spectabilis]KAI8374418.1 hypothetical protein BYT42DRAFT_639592 [Radiomyces spectabilis]